MTRWDVDVIVLTITSTIRRLRRRGEVPLGEVDITGHALMQGAIRGGVPDWHVDQPGPGTVQVRDPQRALLTH